VQLLIRKKSIIFAIVMMILIPISGCKDRKEMEEQAYVSVMGFDKGRDNNLSITFQMINANYGSGAGKSGGGEDEQKTEIITFDAPDIISARDLANISVSRRLTFSHAKVLVVGEDLAKDEKFFQRIQAVLRERELRRGTEIIISREKASEFIRGNDPRLEARINKFYDFMTQRWRETGLVPVSDLNKFMQRTEEGKSLFLAVYGSTKKTVPKTKGGYEADYKPGQVDIEGGNPTELIGAAVFKKGRMIGSLTGEETRLVSLLRKKPDTRTMIFTVPDPKSEEFRVTIRIVRYGNSKLDVAINGENAKIDIKIPIVVEVLSIPSFTNYVENLEMEDVLKKQIQSYLTERCNALIKKTKTEFKAEPFLWELEARKNFNTYPEYEKFDWSKAYLSSEVEVNFAIELKRFGKQLTPPKIPSREEEEE
jgi:Ger(x)C family germination protein